MKFDYIMYIHTTFHKKNSNTFLFLSLLIGLVVLFGLVLSYILWSKLISLIKSTCTFALILELMIGGNKE
jgi:hypothetical protein